MPRINNQTFYENAIKRYGCTARGLNWNSKQSQHIRFEVIHALLEPHLPSSKIVDAGCGFGDLYLFLQQKGSLPRKYIGYDTLQEAIFVAHKRTKQHFARKDILNDELELADFYIASGSMNILNRFETFLFIRRCYEASKKGFVFNLLKGEEKEGHFNYFLPHEIEAYTSEFAYDVEMYEDYMEGDFTVFLKKEDV
ncbi:class I SAM-dependent methyltransferase [Sulfurospirillum diekertiae]|uniref:Methyltransferase n=1 Tax=Sulfurospirillum diekertiae TaxID=1854492 RepID=A0A290HT40_9BACT|nr:class I SAM-dependent methyltransferase [Sulfurospirillum diekertiae]ATB70878.1 putative methyltransferase [Sulfurospirillum diekertiae]QIR75946.1 class I SAM-dependent methyltransferase [Sulfurospirillum diekertiae]QIR78588.1 class I SAM-dependent methyltransferase [Sulfurospirillum diekertiae]